MCQPLLGVDVALVLANSVSIQGMVSLLRNFFAVDVHARVLDPREGGVSRRHA